MLQQSRATTHYLGTGRIKVQKQVLLNCRCKIRRSWFQHHTAPWRASMRCFTSETVASGPTWTAWVLSAGVEKTSTSDFLSLFVQPLPLPRNAHVLKSQQIDVLLLSRASYLEPGSLCLVLRQGGYKIARDTCTTRSLPVRTKSCMLKCPSATGSTGAVLRTMAWNAGAAEEGLLLGEPTGGLKSARGPSASG